jgi:hypothetical protein
VASTEHVHLLSREGVADHYRVVDADSVHDPQDVFGQPHEAVAARGR